MSNEDDDMTVEEWFEHVFSPLNPDLTLEEFQKDWIENIAPMIAENKRKAAH